MNIILASSSKNRQAVLKMVGIDFEIIPSNVDESLVKEVNPVKRAEQIAFLKAQKVAENNQGLIISADTFTFRRRKILEKPQSLKEAEKMLRWLSGKAVYNVTALCVINTQTKEVFKNSTLTRVWFRKLSRGEIKDCVATEPVLTWAAAYSPINSKTAKFIKKTEGSFTGLAFGLPLEQLIPILQKYKLAP